MPKTADGIVPERFAAVKFVKLAPDPLKPVAERTPVEGMKLRAPLVVFSGRLPVLLVAQTGYTAVPVAASLVIAELVALAAVVALATALLIAPPGMPEKLVPVRVGAVE